MFLIYVLTNVITHERYVGQTCHDVESRFKKHLSASKSTRLSHLKLYQAMNKYGTENFDYDIICYTEHPYKDEIYWIEKLNTFNNGYNSNRGGSGGKYQANCPRRSKIDEYSDLDIIKIYQELKNISTVSQKTDLSYKVIRRVLKKHNISIIDSGTVTKKIISKPLAIVDDKGKIIKVFLSQFEACEYVKKELSLTSKDKNIIHYIQKCLNGQYEMAYNHKWKIININDHINEMV